MAGGISAGGKRPGRFWRGDFNRQPSSFNWQKGEDFKIIFSYSVAMNGGVLKTLVHRLHIPLCKYTKNG